MSRIGKEKITIPSEVEVNVADSMVSVKGPKGSLERSIHDAIEINIADGEVEVKTLSNSRLAKSLWGTYASHVKNMIHGVTEGFTKELEIHGVGYRAEINGTNLVLKVGYSHLVEMPIEEGLFVEVKDNTIIISGFDKEQVGEYAASVRRVRKPEPYKGKGIRYKGEYVRIKQGKKSE